MKAASHHWWKSKGRKKAPRVPRFARPRLERLESRIVFAGGIAAAALPFTAAESAHVGGFLSSADRVDLYEVHLGAGDRISAAVSAQTAGSGLQSLLRVFDATGSQRALDDQEGGDPRLSFQAATAGDYFIGVSSSGNDQYLATDPQAGHGGATTGLYSLDVRLTPGAALQSDLTASTFRLMTHTAAVGDQIGVEFAVENRGAADAGNFTVQVVLASNDLFDSSSTILGTFTRAQLTADATGQRFASPTGFTVALPAGTESGPVDVGLRIVTDPLVTDASAFDKSGVHRGEDWEALTVVTPVPAGGADLSAADASLDTRLTGTLPAGGVDTYTFTVTAAQGTGRLTATLAPSVGLAAQLSLYGQHGRLLIQSDGGSIVQHLTPGSYSLTVSALGGAGAYGLATAFVPAGPPLTSVPVGNGPKSVLTADLNGDGTPDLIVANEYANTVSVLLGIGDGSFQAQQVIAVGTRPSGMAVADLNGDGRPDLVVTNSGDGTVAVLLGVGDGTFQPSQTYGVGSQPSAVAVADINGDGIPDLVVTNGFDGTVGVLLGTGTGSFGAEQTFRVGSNPFSVAVADFNGDGRPDLVVANEGTLNAPGNTVGVLLNTTTPGASLAAFAPQMLSTVGSLPSSVVVGDFNGRPDIVTTNILDNTVSVLLGKGDGTFQAPRTLSIEGRPDFAAVADVNGDGKPDLVVTSYYASVSVLLGQGDGSFRKQPAFNAGSRAVSVAVADLDGDGKPDLVVPDLGISGVGTTVNLLRGNGDGSFRSGGAVGVGPTPSAEAVGDLNGDGKPDLVVANYGTSVSPSTVTVLLGNGDGTFQPGKTFAVGFEPSAVLIADVNGDGRPDLIVADGGSNAVSVLLGNGDGTFQKQQTYDVGANPVALAVADVNGDKIPDLLVASNGTTGQSPEVSILEGKGDGKFVTTPPLLLPSTPGALAVAHLAGDGPPDLLVEYGYPAKVRRWSIPGDGTLRKGALVKVGSGCDALAVADINGDGVPDLVTADYNGYVNVVLGNRDGTFRTPKQFVVGRYPVSLAVADLDGDGRPDIVTADKGDNAIDVLRNTTPAGAAVPSFATPQSHAVGYAPSAVVTADLNGDGRPDIITTNKDDNTATVLLTSGAFQAPVSIPVGATPGPVAAGVLISGGHVDLVVPDATGNTVRVLLGNGDGTFQTPVLYAVGASPSSVTIADVNGDGIPDLIVSNAVDGSVSVLLGNGDGTFQTQNTYAVGVSPQTVTVTDLNGDGIPDLVVTNAGSSTISVLFGKGDGTFLPQQTFAVGSSPSALSVADLNGDGKADLVVANYSANTISVLLGNGDGTFQPPQFLASGSGPGSLAVADVNGDGHPDIVVANAQDNSISVLLGNGDGTVQPEQTYAVRSTPSSVAIADVNGDGRPDLVVTSYDTNTVSVLLNNGDGTFATPFAFATGVPSLSVTVADVNGDGKPDLLVPSGNSNSVSLLLGNGPVAFKAATPTNGIPSRNTPYQVDLDGDGIPDSVVLNRSGQIVFRKGLAGNGVSFAPPIVLNDAKAIGEDRPARDMAIVHTATGFAIATADARFDTNLLASTVSLYTLGKDDSVTRTTAFTSTVLPTRIFAVDLVDPVGTVNGLDDIVLANSLDNSIQVVLQNPDGTFGLPLPFNLPATDGLTLATGVSPSDITFADVDNDGYPDIVATDQASGDITLFLNQGDSPFSRSVRLRAGSGPFGLTSDATPAVGSLNQSVSLASGDLTGGGLNDLVVVNRGTHSFTVLQNDGNGGFANPTAALTTPISTPTDIPEQPGPVLVGHFGGISSALDVAILMTDTSEIWVYRNKGDGTFDAPVINAAGAGATGFSFVGGNGTTPDRFLVGNGFGDILTLVGDGTGKFAIDRSDFTTRPLAVGKTSDGRSFAVVADPQLDKVQVHFRDTAALAGFDSPQAAPDNTAAPLLAPGAVVLGDLQGTDGKTPPYLIVANRLGNQVLVYPGLPGGGFGTPTAYAVGFEPVAVTVADLNGDGVPDLVVVNHGSNDLSIITGSIDANGMWKGTAGPRLDTGGSGPIAVAVADFNGDGIPDLRVTNSDGTISTLAGIGSGSKGTAFFKPASDIQSLGAAITQVAFDPTTNREYFVSGGAIHSFDGTSFATVGAAGGVDTLGVVDGLLVAGFADGSVGLMTEGGVMLDQSSSFGDQPSALQALQDGGSIDVYLTLDGSTVPTFVSLLIPVVTELPASPAVAQATGLAGGELVLVATLLSGSLEEGTQQDIQVAAAEASFVLFLPPVKVSGTNVVTGQVKSASVSVALVVRADPDGLPPTEEFRQRVKDALMERLETRQVFDSVEDLVETIKRVLDQFGGESKPDEEQAVFRGRLEFVALDRVAEAVVGVRERVSSVGTDAASPDGESLWCLESAVLVSWLCRPPAERGGSRAGRIVSGWARS